MALETLLGSMASLREVSGTMHRGSSLGVFASRSLTVSSSESVDGHAPGKEKAEQPGKKVSWVPIAHTRRRQSKAMETQPEKRMMMDLGSGTNCHVLYLIYNISLTALSTLSAK